MDFTETFFLIVLAVILLSVLLPDQVVGASRRIGYTARRAWDAFREGFREGKDVRK